MNLPRTIVLATIICLPFSVPFVASTSVESRVMSNHVKPFQTFMDRVIEDQMRRGLTTNNVLNINALDELDPVHHRAQRARADQGEADHDGDMGREQQDYDRDNGRLHVRGGSGIAPWRQIADALPKVEAPSLIPDQHQTEENTNGEAPTSAMDARPARESR